MINRIILSVTFFMFQSILSAQCNNGLDITYPNVNSTYVVGDSINPINPILDGTAIIPTNYSTIIASGLGYISGFVLDSLGNIIVADYGNSSIKRIDANGTVTIILSNIQYLGGVTIDTEDLIYFIEGSYVKRINSDGAIVIVYHAYDVITGLVVDDFNRLYVIWGESGTLFRFDLNTQQEEYLFGELGEGASAIYKDSNGDIYLSDLYGQDCDYDFSSICLDMVRCNPVKKIVGNGFIETTRTVFSDTEQIAVDNHNNIYTFQRRLNSCFFKYNVLRIDSNGHGDILFSDNNNYFKNIIVDPMGQYFYAVISNHANFWTPNIQDDSLIKVMLNNYSISPALPNGLKLDSVTGTISGEPQETTPLTTYTIAVKNACGTQYIPISFETTSINSILKLKFYIQGYYDLAGTMYPIKSMRMLSPGNQVEDIEVSLFDINTQSVRDSQVVTLLYDGSVRCNFESSIIGNYFVKLKGENFLETWSSTPINLGSTIAFYDFSTAKSKALGDNSFELYDGVFALYSGDINQDGNIDNTDYSLWESDSNNFYNGIFPTDLNGDGNIDNNDYSIWESNANNFISVYRP